MGRARPLPPPRIGRGGALSPTRHHLDGAQAAQRVVRRYYAEDGGARASGIVQAIHEHQIVPPRFMAKLARGTLVGQQRTALILAFKDVFPAEVASGQPDPAGVNGRTLRSILTALDEATGVDPTRRVPLQLNAEQTALLGKMGVAPAELGRWSRSVNGVRDRIASPLGQPRTPDGTRIQFTADERRLLKGVGIDDWIVPARNAPHSAISEFVRIGDMAANYTSSPAGVAKIVAISGPGTPFAVRTVWDSIKSANESFKDALTVIPEEHRPLLQEMRSRTIGALRETARDVRQWVKENKASYGYRPDEPVLYLDRNATTEGLSADQAARREVFAREIRSKVEQGLRSRQGAWANVGKAPYDVDDIARQMRARPELATTKAAVGTVPEPGQGRSAGPASGRGGTPLGAADDISLVGVRPDIGRRVAGEFAKSAVIGAALGVGIEAGRELVVEGRIDPRELWRNTLGDIQSFWKPLAGGTAGAMVGGAIAAGLVPGGRLVATGLQFLGGSLGASAAGGHLAKEPGRAVAGAIGSAAGSMAGAVMLGWLLPPVGAAVGSVAGGIAGQVAGEWLYGALSRPRHERPVAGPARGIVHNGGEGPRGLVRVSG